MTNFVILQLQHRNLHLMSCECNLHFPTWGIICQMFHNTTVWWKNYLLPFHVSWKPRCPCLPPIDFWLWGIPKILYVHIQSVDYILINAVTRAIQQITLAMIRASMLSTICRMQSIIVWERRHVECLWNAIKYFAFLYLWVLIYPLFFCLFVFTVCSVSCRCVSC